METESCQLLDAFLMHYRVGGKKNFTSLFSIWYYASTSLLYFIESKGSLLISTPWEYARTPYASLSKGI